jgi:hypothetical protein
MNGEKVRIWREAVVDYLKKLTRHRTLFFKVSCFGLRLWSSGQSVWLQMQRSRVRFPAVPHFLDRGPLSLVRTIEKLLE